MRMSPFLVGFLMKIGYVFRPLLLLDFSSERSCPSFMVHLPSAGSPEKNLFEHRFHPPRCDWNPRTGRPLCSYPRHFLVFDQNPDPTHAHLYRDFESSLFPVCFPLPSISLLFSFWKERGCRGPAHPRTHNYNPRRAFPFFWISPSAGQVKHPRGW